jgi:hypothetical protein
VVNCLLAKQQFSLPENIRQHTSPISINNCSGKASHRFKNQLTILSCEKVLKVFLSQVTNNEVSSAKHKSSIWNLVLFADPLNVIPIPGKNLSANR